MITVMSDESQAQKYREQEEHSTQDRAALLGLRYLDTREMAATTELLPGILTNDQMYRMRMVPLRRAESAYVFGITSGTPQSAMRSLTQQYSERGNAVEYLLISDSGYKAFMLRYDPPPEVHYDDVVIAEEGDSATLRQVSATLDSVKTDDILSYLIDQADRLAASDIHIENQKDDVRIRLRVDGALHPIAQLSHDKYRVLQASIASKANISTAAPEAQTGHMQQVSALEPGKNINMRIETVPTVYGQDVVIRIFRDDSQLLTLENLGLSSTQRQQIDDIIAHPHGMVMVVGPTGSGKSTTLYSMINQLNDPSRKVITLEDPVEISLPGISQIPVNTGAGDSFAEKLRAVLRLDPDVVMVGEIRDADTARTAMQASITGHLVLSTFHASSAAAAFTRMIDMIGQNPIFINAIRLVMSQRLVRRLDDATKIPYAPDDTTKQWMRGVLAELPGGVERPDIDAAQLWRPGKSGDVPFGYKGRIVLMEQLPVTDRVQESIRGEARTIDLDDIERAARAEGMVTMQQAGVLKALAGETTLEEVNRVL